LANKKFLNQQTLQKLKRKEASLKRNKEERKREKKKEKEKKIVNKLTCSSD